MSNRQATTKRYFLHAAAVAGLIALPCLIAGQAQAQKQHVTLRLDWLYQGPNSGFMVAKDKGYYDEAGLDVEMGPGRGSGSTAQLVASKATMFGFADGYVVGNSVSKGMNITMVASIYRRNPTAVVVLKELPTLSPSRTLKARPSRSRRVRRNSSNGRPLSKAAISTAARSA